MTTTMMTARCIMSAITTVSQADRSVGVDKSSSVDDGPSSRHRPMVALPPLCVDRWFMTDCETRKTIGAEQRGHRPTRHCFALGCPRGTAPTHWCPATISRCRPAGGPARLLWIRWRPKEPRLLVLLSVNLLKTIIIRGWWVVTDAQRWGRLSSRLPEHAANSAATHSCVSDGCWSNWARTLTT